MSAEAQHVRGRRDVSEVLSIAGAFARARIALRGTKRGARVRCYGRVLVPQRVGVEVGERSVFFAGTIPTELRCESGAELVIGPRTLLNYGVSIVARRSVRIGAGCMIASLVHIRDDDGRHTAPVKIGDNVWIAFGAVIDPGSTIGDGAVIGTMAVVSGAVPPGSLATGNPAQYLPLSPDSKRLSVANERGVVRSTGPATTDVCSDAMTGPDAGEVRAVIVEWLDDTRHFGAAASLLHDDAMPLRTGGLLDSLGIVQLVLMLEKRFGVTIDRERVASVDSLSMNSFIQLVTRSKGNRS